MSSYELFIYIMKWTAICIPIGLLWRYLFWKK